MFPRSVFTMTSHIWRNRRVARDRGPEQPLFADPLFAHPFILSTLNWSAVVIKCNFEGTLDRDMYVLSCCILKHGGTGLRYPKTTLKKKTIALNI